MICDFCFHPDVRWTFRVQPYGTMIGVAPDGRPIAHLEDGAWTACDACKELIEEGAWAAMLARSVDHAHELDTPMRGYPRSVVRQSVTVAHEFFRESWKQVGSPAPTVVSA